ncbi:MAG: hypothetical protein ACI4V0_09640 [Lachnospiraceae bacterium]
MFISLKICMALNNSDIVEYRGLSFESLYQRKEVLNRGGVKMKQLPRRKSSYDFILDML